MDLTGIRKPECLARSTLPIKCRGYVVFLRLGSSRGPLPTSVRASSGLVKSRKKVPGMGFRVRNDPVSPQLLLSKNGAARVRDYQSSMVPSEQNHPAQLLTMLLDAHPPREKVLRIPSSLALDPRSMKEFPEGSKRDSPGGQAPSSRLVKGAET